MRHICVCCGTRGSNSPRHNKFPPGYQFICGACRANKAPNEHRCIALNHQKVRCGHYKSHGNDTCSVHTPKTSS